MSPTPCQVSEKIVGAVSENEPGRTNGRTDGGDSIGPFGFQPGTNKVIIT